MSTVVKSNANIVYTCHYHVVWCPKYRRKVLVNGVDARLKVLVQEIVEKWGQEFVECEVMPDHVHLLVGCDPQCLIDAAAAILAPAKVSHHSQVLGWPRCGADFSHLGRTVRFHICTASSPRAVPEISQYFLGKVGSDANRTLSGFGCALLA